MRIEFTTTELTYDDIAGLEAVLNMARDRLKEEDVFARFDPPTEFPHLGDDDAEPQIDIEEVLDTAQHIDAAGLRWNAEIHSTPPKLNSDGKYRRRRGISDVDFNRLAYPVTEEMLSPPATIGLEMDYGGREPEGFAPPPPPLTVAEYAEYETPAELVEAPVEAAPPPPPPVDHAMTAQEAPPADVDFKMISQEVMRRRAEGSLTIEEVSAYCTTLGLANLAGLISRTDLHGAFWQLLNNA